MSGNKGEAFLIAEFKITKEDLIAQQRNALKNTKFHKKTRIMQLVIYFFAVILIVFIINPSPSNIRFGLLLFLVLSPLSWWFYGYAVINRFKKDVLKHLKNKIGPITLSLSEDKIIKESQHLTEKIQWNELVRFTEDEKRYFLYLSDINIITIKKEPDNMNTKEIMEYQAFIKTKVNN